VSFSLTSCNCSGGKFFVNSGFENVSGIVKHTNAATKVATRIVTPTSRFQDPGINRYPTARQKAAGDNQKRISASLERGAGVATSANNPVGLKTKPAST
jgi:hypothetical protein